MTPRSHRQPIGRRPFVKGSPTEPAIESLDALPFDHPGVRRPGRGRAAPIAPGARAYNPKYRLATMQKGMVGWALFNSYFALFLTFSTDRNLGTFGFLTDFVLMLSCMIQLFVGSFLLKLPARLPVAGSLFAIFMTWAVATTLLANGDIGRSLYAAVSYYIFWGFFGIFVYAAVEMGVNLSPNIRKLIVVPWLCALAFSGVIGFLQLVGVGFALALSPSQAFGAVFRPTGISDYTFMFGMQGVLGMALVGARLRQRDLKLWEWAAVGFFMLVILIAQYRSLYYTGILLAGVLLLILQFRRNKTKGLIMTGIAAATILAPLVLFPQKFEYGMRGAENDPALAVRYAAWQQLGPVLHDRPLTGIGADQNLMIANDLASIDKYAGVTIDNFYRMVLICYGYMGGLLITLTLIALTIGLFMRYDSTRAPEVKTYTIAGIIVFAALVGVSLTGNSFVYRQVGYSFAVLLALGNPSWAERRLVDPVSPFVAFLRTLSHSPLRVLFPSIGRVR